MSAAPGLKARALRYLAAREHSRAELARKLARHAGEGDDIEALLDSLEGAQFQSDQRFAENLVHRRAARFGTSRIMAELGQHNIDPEALGELKTRLGADETTRALEVWRKKFGTPAQDAAGRARQARFLAQRGFSSRSISAVLRMELDD